MSKDMDKIKKKERKLADKVLKDCDDKAMLDLLLLQDQKEEITHRDNREQQARMEMSRLENKGYKRTADEAFSLLEMYSASQEKNRKLQ